MDSVTIAFNWFFNTEFPSRLFKSFNIDKYIDIKYLNMSQYPNKIDLCSTYKPNKYDFRIKRAVHKYNLIMYEFNIFYNKFIRNINFLNNTNLVLDYISPYGTFFDGFTFYYNEKYLSQFYQIQIVNIILCELSNFFSNYYFPLYYNSEDLNSINFYLHEVLQFLKFFKIIDYDQFNMAYNYKQYKDKIDIQNVNNIFYIKEKLKENDFICFFRINNNTCKFILNQNIVKEFTNMNYVETQYFKINDIDIFKCAYHILSCDNSKLILSSVNNNGFYKYFYFKDNCKLDGRSKICRNVKFLLDATNSLAD